jgi:hypothetical protein
MDAVLRKCRIVRTSMMDHGNSLDSNDSTECCDALDYIFRCASACIAHDTAVEVWPKVVLGNASWIKTSHCGILESERCI